MQRWGALSGMFSAMSPLRTSDVLPCLTVLLPPTNSVPQRLAEARAAELERTRGERARKEQRRQQREQQRLEEQ